MVQGTDVVDPGTSGLLGAVIVTAVWTAWLLLSVRRDRRRLRNGFLAMAAVYSLTGVIAQAIRLLPGGTDVLGWIGLTVVGLVGLTLFALPILLVINGVIMLRRERASLRNLLSLVAGVGLVAAPCLALGLAVGNRPWTWALAGAVTLATMWLAFTFVGFLAQTLLYRRLVRSVPARAVIVLGSRVVGGRVPPLLAGRLQTGLDAATELGDADGPVPLVPSGGQGPDEDRPEGVAMADWLHEHGAVRVLVEDRARTTQENLRFSAALLHAEGVAPPYLMATNDYHAPRAALEAMDLGLDIHAIGARTARYFLPSAYLREFAAVLRRRPFVHALAAAFILVCSALIYRVA